MNIIRPIVLGVVKRGNKTLAGKGYDPIKDQTFYRSIGGGIEFQEQSREALKREFKEELDIDINPGKYLGVSENIFVFNGKPGHEIVLFYEVEIDESDYKDSYLINEDGEEMMAEWVDIEKIKDGEIIIYPEEVVNYL